MSYIITCYDVLLNVHGGKLHLDVLHVQVNYRSIAALIGKFWKISNPHIFQTNNPERLSLVQMKELFKSFLMIYHKCQKTQFKKSTKTLTEKKSIPSTKSHPSINVGWNKNPFHIIQINFVVVPLKEFAVQLKLCCP